MVLDTIEVQARRALRERAVDKPLLPRAPPLFKIAAVWMPLGEIQRRKLKLALMVLRSLRR